MRKTVRAIVVKDNKLLVMHRNKFGKEYYALIGGGIDPGETPEQALYREVAEETSIHVSNPRLVIVEDAGEVYGTQYIYTCDYVDGEPALASDSEEAQIHALGKNLYTPMWLSIEDLPETALLPESLKQVLIKGLKEGFPDQPLQLNARNDLV